MKKAILIIWIILAFVIAGIGQSYELVLKSKSSGMEKPVAEGSTIIVFNKNGTTYRGDLKMISTELLAGLAVIRSDTNFININEIKALKVKRSRNYSFENTLLNEPFKNSTSCTEIIIETVFIGVIIAIVELFVVITEKKYKSAKWDYYIRTK